MTKKLLVFALLVSMLVSLAACTKDKNETGTDGSAESGTTSSEATKEEGSGEESKTYEQVVYSYATFNNIPSEEALTSVEDAINAITRDKIGVEVQLMPINIAEYSQKVSLALQSGEKLDIFETLGDFNVRVSAKMAYDITDLIDEHAAETKAIIGEEILAAAEKDGRSYGIPTYKPYALTPMVIYKKAIADELGIDMNEVKNLNDLTEVLRQVKAAYPEMTPLIPANSGDSGVARTIANVDFLTDDYFSPKGVLFGDDLTVVDYYASDEFMEVSKIARTWYEEELILQDAATTTSTGMELMASENSFCYIASYSYPPEDTAISLTAQLGGGELGAVQIGGAYLDTTAINALTWMVSSTSDVPEAALKFLNLTFSDKDIVNLLIYGIEGRDYVLNEAKQASYPEGQDATTVPYTAQISVGTLGNFFNMYPTVGVSEESLLWEEEQNRISKKSPVMGFIFDSSNVKTEYTAVNNVIQQYLPILSTGAVDPEVSIPDFVEQLKLAGLDTIIAEKQAQLDLWLENKK